MCAEPIVILSDVHLPRRGWRKRFERLRPLWSGSSTVVFNGDTLNLRPEPGRPDDMEVPQYIARTCEAEGVRAVIIAGNSDFGLGPPHHLLLADGKVLVTHGHAIFRELSPWWSKSRQVQAAREAVLEQMPPSKRSTLEAQFESAQRALREVWSAEESHIAAYFGRCLGNVITGWFRPWLIGRLLRAWRIAPKMASEFVQRYLPEGRFVIFGHTHRAGVWSTEGRIVINTGSLVGPGRATIVRIHGGQIVVRRIARRRGRYLPGRVVARFRLTGDGDRPAPPT